MAEVFGIVTGTVGLLPLVSNGIVMIMNVFGAPEAIKDYKDRVRMQHYQFLQWAEIWNTPSHETPKFLVYSKRQPEAARGLIDQLGLLSETLFNAQKLQNIGLKPRGGFGSGKTPSPDLIRPVIEKVDDLSRETIRARFQAFELSCKGNMSFIKNCKFVLKNDNAGWENLIQRLIEYNNNLRTFAPEFDQVLLIKGLCNFLQLIPPEELPAMIRAAHHASQLPHHSLVDSQRSDSYRKIESAASFGATIRSDRQLTSVNKFPITSFRIEDNYLVSTSPESTMAMLHNYPLDKDRRVVLIEWIDLGDKTDEAAYEETKAKADLLSMNIIRPAQLLLPGCYGIVERWAYNRKQCGLILTPPVHIRKIAQDDGRGNGGLPQGFVSKRRKPSTLYEILKEAALSRTVMNLGVRFRLAKKLIDAVNMMHCVGWVHKGIRSESIIFYPQDPNRSHGDGSAIRSDLAYEEPQFVGFGRARPDKIVEVVKQGYVDYGEIIRKKTIIDYYQHPDKRQEPAMAYSRSFDIYSLGCVLLEIATWQPLEYLADIHVEPRELASMLKSIAKSQDGRVGSVYSNVVYQCLNVKIFDSTAAGSKALSSFCTNISAELERCFA